MTGNIVQAEFFHVGGKNVHSLEHLVAEMQERIADGFELALSADKPISSGIKTVVRFFDDGSITRYVQRYARLSRLEKKLGTAVFSWARPWKIVANLAHHVVLTREMDKKEAATSLAAEALAKNIFERGQIALERLDHSFRLASRGEMHELLERVLQARYVWIFVFEPNDLLADSNKAVAHLM